MAGDVARRYGAAAAATTAALGIGLALDPLAAAVPFPLLLAAVTFSAWYGGAGPAGLATLAGAAAIDQFFLVPAHAPASARVGGLLQVAAFLLVALLISALNVRLREASRRAEAALADAEAARRRVTFLAEAGTLLSAARGYEARLSSLARVAVPFLADFCAVDVVEDERRVRRLAVAHVDPGVEQRIHELGEACPMGPDGASPFWEALRTGRSLLVRDVDSLWLLGQGTSVDTRALVRELRFLSAMAVPLVARGRTLGALVLASSAMSYGADDLALAEDLARSAALAVDNARLYRDERDAVRLREEVLATVSHDLTNPLAAVKGRARLLHRQAIREPDARLSAVTVGLMQIDNAATHALDIVGDLLDATRLEAGRPLELERGPIDLVRLAREAAETSRYLAPQHAVEVVADADELVGMWDGRRLERVLENLLSNACKYSPEGSPIRIVVEAHRDGAGAWAVVGVQDQGLGIPAADVPHVFDRFFRAGNVRGRIPGTGLGLAGARRIVEQHGGTLTVETREGHGSTFVARLPRALDVSASGAGETPAGRAALAAPGGERGRLAPGALA